MTVIQKFMTAGVTASMWKRDISKAFRLANHHDLAWTVWQAEGKIWVAQHFGMPSGTVKGVYASHRVGRMMWLILVRLFKAPACRYMWMYFGASRSGVAWSAAPILTVMPRLLGFPTDSSKDADATWYMVVLGALVSISWGGAESSHPCQQRQGKEGPVCVAANARLQQSHTYQLFQDGRPLQFFCHCVRQSCGSGLYKALLCPSSQSLAWKHAVSMAPTSWNLRVGESY